MSVSIKAILSNIEGFPHSEIAQAISLLNQYKYFSLDDLQRVPPTKTDLRSYGLSLRSSLLLVHMLPQKIRSLISWRDERDVHSVSVYGSWNQWNETEGIVLKRLGNNWEGHIEVFPGEYEFKFKVNGEWRRSDFYPQVNSHWNNNMLKVVPDIHYWFQNLLALLDCFSLTGLPPVEYLSMGNRFYGILLHLYGYYPTEDMRRIILWVKQSIQKKQLPSLLQLKQIKKKLVIIDRSISKK